MKFAFFGTPEIAVTALEKMEAFGFLPALVVCNPDASVGRKHIITPPPTKVWAEARQIPVFQPTSLRERSALAPLTDNTFDLFVVFAYGKIIPEWLLSLPQYGTINAHPSLLPKLRGASPIRSTLLSDLSAAGVTIIQMDAELDHGPILHQEPIALEQPIPGRELDTIAARMCGCLLVHVMKKLQNGAITPAPQDHTTATFCTKITKDMAQLDINPRHLPAGDAALEAFRKICAFDGWPEAYFMHEGKRVKIKRAELAPSGELRIVSVVPEGKKEMKFTQYLDSLSVL